MHLLHNIIISAVPAAATDDLFEADIYNAMKPVQPMAYDVPAVPNITVSTCSSW